MLNWNKCNKIDVVEGLKSLPDESIDIEIIDPPYNIGKDFGNNFDKLEINEYVEWCRLWIDFCFLVLKSVGYNILQIKMLLQIHSGNAVTNQLYVFGSRLIEFLI